MNRFYKLRSGFTLLELLLTIAILAILAAVTLAAINPVRQMSEARDSQRKNDVAEIQKSIQEYFYDKGSYPFQVADVTVVYGICGAKVYSAGLDSSDCGNLVNISQVIPAYLSDIPRDPLASKIGPDTYYRVALNKQTGLYVEAPKTEVGQGEKKTIIFVGKPPYGYVIPQIKVDISTTTVAAFFTNVSMDVAGWPTWVYEIIILVAGIIAGYILGVLVTQHKKLKPKIKE